jgi:hypothetical protein
VVPFAQGRFGHLPPRHKDEAFARFTLIAWQDARVTRILLVVIGLAVALAGVIWTLQGLGYVGGSFMTGATIWAIIGPVVALAGLVLAVAALRSRRERS